MNLFDSRICTFKEKINGPGGRFTKIKYTEWSKSEREKQIPYANTYVWNLKKTVSEEPRGRTEIKTQT